MQPQKTTPKNLQTWENTQFAAKEGKNYGHLGRRNGGIRTSLQMRECICNAYISGIQKCRLITFFAML